MTSQLSHIKALKKSVFLEPFLKWPGGKRWFVEKYLAVFPSDFKRLIEPFLGSGCVFFALNPPKAILSDINTELISAYRGIRSDWATVEDLLERHGEDHDDYHYYAVRDSRPRGLARKAARFIYLNRTCFNGIFRVNAQGLFNVPKGTRDIVLRDSDDFKPLARALKRAKLLVSDFEPMIAQAGKGDVVFADPPYTVRHNLNGFVQYNEMLFSWADQIRLAQALRAAHERGAYILATNANHESVRSLYADGPFAMRCLNRFSSISGDPIFRKSFGELLITNVRIE